MTTPTERPRHRPRIDSLLVAAAVFAIIVIQWNSDRNSPRHLLFALLPAFGYLLVTIHAANTPVAHAAARAYLLCLMTGIVGLAVTAHDLLGSLRDQVQAGEIPYEDLHAHLVGAVLAILPQLFTPLIAGVAVYAVCSPHDSSHEPQSVVKPAQLHSLLDQLEAWSRDSRAPELIREFMADMHSQLTEFRSSYQGLADVTGDTEQRLQSVGRAAADLTNSLAELHRVGGTLARDLGELGDRLARAQAGLDHLESSVSEIDNVVNEFADIASHGILDYVPSTEPAARTRLR